jgi:hypothetical protein
MVAGTRSRYSAGQSHQATPTSSGISVSTLQQTASGCGAVHAAVVGEHTGSQRLTFSR